MGRADHPRRGAHLRHGPVLRQVRHLLQRRPALRAGRCRVTRPAYREAKNGQILEEGITEAGSMSSFIAAGTAYATHGVPTIPFFIYYSMFGFQRIGDLIWAAADMRTPRLPAGRHRRPHDAQRRGLAARGRPQPRPGLDGAERGGLRPGLRLRAGRHPPRRHPPHVRGRTEDVFYYITLYNDNYPMLPMPEGAAEGILKGMYKLPAGGERRSRRRRRSHLLGSGPILPHALRGAGDAGRAVRRGGRRLERRPATRSCAARPWRCERWNLLHPTEKPRQSYLRDAAGEGGGRRSWRPATTCGRCRR